MANDKNGLPLAVDDLVSVPCRVLHVDLFNVILQTIETDTRFVLRGMHVLKSDQTNPTNES